VIPTILCVSAGLASRKSTFNQLRQAYLLLTLRVHPGNWRHANATATFQKLVRDWETVEAATHLVVPVTKWSSAKAVEPSSPGAFQRYMKWAPSQHGHERTFCERCDPATRLERFNIALETIALQTNALASPKPQETNQGTLAPQVQTLSAPPVAPVPKDANASPGHLMHDVPQPSSVRASEPESRHS